MATFLNNFHDLEIQLEEIRSATNNFDDSRVIGSGGFGKVYIGELTLPEGKSMVAFKRLDRIHGQGVPEFFKEITMLSSYKHDNLISLILFQPLEKVEHEQVLEDEKLSNDSLHWTMKKDLFSNLFKKSKGQKGYSLDKNGKKCLTLSARGVIRSYKLSFKSLPESRFQEVAVITYRQIDIKKEIKSDGLSPETTYACYLVYKSTEGQPVLRNGYTHSYTYLVSPPDTPIIGQKLDQNTHNQTLNKPKLNVLPRQRSDGWMEVKVLELQTPSSTTATIYINLNLWTPHGNNISGLVIESIELKPKLAHSV